MENAKKELYKRFAQLEIKTQLYSHEPLYTVEQAKKVALEIGLPGAGCKNLFLKDSKNRLWLLVAMADTKIELKKLSKALHAPELRFANAELLKNYLGVEPGAVTPFGLISDKDHFVRVILDAALFNQELISFHPLTNDATLTITPEDLKRFIESCGNEIIIHSFVF